MSCCVYGADPTWSWIEAFLGARGQTIFCIALLHLTEIKNFDWLKEVTWLLTSNQSEFFREVISSGLSIELRYEMVSCLSPHHLQPVWWPADLDKNRQMLRKSCPNIWHGSFYKKNERFRPLSKTCQKCRRIFGHLGQKVAQIAINRSIWPHCLQQPYSTT